MSEPWYQDGLRFECTQCGKCCTGEPGYVWVTDEEVAAIAAFLGEDVAEVKARDTRLAYRNRRTLREKENGDCVFLVDRKCSIYELRPRQCRTWPFWESNVATPAAWARTCEVCPGSGKGELIPVEEIKRRVNVIAL